MNEYTLRHATRDDIPDLLSAERLSFTDPWSEGMLASSLCEGVDITLLLCGDTVIGYSVLDRRVPGEAELHKIAMIPNYRGRGLSKLLMDSLLRSAKCAGVSDIFLEVRAKNAPAIGLYEKYGFIRLGVRRGYYKNPTDDALTMKLELCKNAESV